MLKSLRAAYAGDALLKLSFKKLTSILIWHWQPVVSRGALEQLLQVPVVYPHQVYVRLAVDARNLSPHCLYALLTVRSLPNMQLCKDRQDLLLKHCPCSLDWLI